ncbi:unnamed protein product [Porites lobata]|uniref:Uncharacterized protein n=1 Tax=Porites lobata TaxID=104759 RepID=A0ABN8N507_9CNID|nr:unnamed protein product [Porites lobata]
MAQSRFATVTSDEISKINEEAIPDNTKKATKFGLAVFTEWFQMQEEFKTPFEEMSPIQLNKCLQKFYLSARKREGSYYNKKSLIAIRAALDRHLKSPPFSKPFSIVGDTPTVHKQALT